jgi:GntR family transcriptional regulator/MocR family aminotransferase
MSLRGGAPKTRRYSRLNCDGLSWPTRRQAEAGIADFIAEGHFSRHLKKMRLVYAERRALTSRVFQEILGDRIRIDLQPGRLHIVAKLADHEDDVMLADHARTAGLALHPLSR